MTKTSIPTPISIEEYKELFCQQVKGRNRYPVYVSRKTHIRLKKAANNLMMQHMNMSALVENILVHHLSLYEKLIQQIASDEFDRVFGVKDE